MGDETSANSGQAPTTSTPQAGNPQTSGQAPEGTQQKPSMSLEDALAALKAAREDAANHRVSNKDLLAKLKEHEDAKLSEGEKKDKALSEAQQAHATAQERLQRLTVRAAVLELAPELGINPKLAARLIDWSSLKIDEEGNPTNIDKVLAALLQEFPQIAAQQPSNQQQQPAPRQQVPPSNPQRSSGNGLSGQSPRNISWSEAFKKQ